MRFFRDKLTGERVRARPLSGLPEASDVEDDDLAPGRRMPSAEAHESEADETKGAGGGDDLAPADPPYQDPFAARARMKSYPVRGPIRRRIWDLEEPEEEDDASSQSERRAGGARITSRVRPVPQEGEDDGFLTDEVEISPAQRLLTRRLSDPSQRAPGGAASAAKGHGGQVPPDDDVAEARAQLAKAAGQSRPGAQTGAQTASSASARTKTRILGFQGRELAAHDPFTQENEAAPAPMSAAGPSFPVGWIVVADGPGRGASFTLQSGVSSIGRGEDQVVRLDFGDTSISRQNHASIAFDDESERFFLGHGGKSNLVRLNDRPVLSTEDLNDGDIIRIGETSLRFAALCKDGFSWGTESESDEPVVEETARRSTMRVDTRPGLGASEIEPPSEAPASAPDAAAEAVARAVSRQLSRPVGFASKGASSDADVAAPMSGKTGIGSAAELPSQRGTGDATTL